MSPDSVPLALELPEPEPRDWWFVCHIGTRRLGLAANEVLTLLPATLVSDPGAAGGDGVVVHDGQVLPVLDLARRLGRADRCESRCGVIAICHTAVGPLALRFDAIGEMRDLVARPLPAAGGPGDWPARLLRGVGYPAGGHSRQEAAGAGLPLLAPEALHAR